MISRIFIFGLLILFGRHASAQKYYGVLSDVFPVSLNIQEDGKIKLMLPDQSEPINFTVEMENEEQIIGQEIVEDHVLSEIVLEATSKGYQAQWTVESKNISYEMEFQRKPITRKVSASNYQLNWPDETWILQVQGEYLLADIYNDQNHSSSISMSKNPSKGWQMSGSNFFVGRKESIWYRVNINGESKETIGRKTDLKHALFLDRSLMVNLQYPINHDEVFSDTMASWVHQWVHDIKASRTNVSDHYNSDFVLGGFDLTLDDDRFLSGLLYCFSNKEDFNRRKSIIYDKKNKKFLTYQDIFTAKSPINNNYESWAGDVFQNHSNVNFSNQDIFNSNITINKKGLVLHGPYNYILGKIKILLPWEGSRKYIKLLHPIRSLAND